MTSVVPFVPSNVKPFSFNASLDGGNYNIVLTWNVSAQRFYINVYGLDGSWVITTPLVASPPARPLQSAIYDPFLNQVLVTMMDPSLWPVPLAAGGIVTKPGTMIDYTLENFQPNTYNGLFRGMHINELMFSYPMASDPGPVLIMGSVSRKLNMIQGVFTVSSLIYRNGAFEVDP